MSVTTFWMFATVPAGKHCAVTALLEKLSEPLPPDTLEVVAEWRASGELPFGTARYGDFVTAFQAFEGGDIEVAEVLDPKDTYLVEPHVGLNRDVPGALLFYGLGRERAEQLPGRFTNIVIEATDVASTLVHVKQVLDVDVEAFCDRLRPVWIGNNDEADMPRLLTALPDALEAARQRERGLFAFNIVV